MTSKPEPDAPEAGAWTCRLEPRGRNHVLHLQGALHAGWVGRLASGLAARKVSVVRGEACRSRGTFWAAELELEVHDPKFDPATFDCFELISERTAPATPPGDLLLGRYQLTPRPGALEVNIDAPDSVGLLDRLLRTFAFFGLFPSEFRVQTHGAGVEGVFQLQALGQTEPRLQVIEGLDRRLAGLLEQRDQPRPAPRRAPRRDKRG